MGQFRCRVPCTGAGVWAVDEDKEYGVPASSQTAPSPVP